MTGAKRNSDSEAVIWVDGLYKAVTSGSETLTILKGISLEIKAGESIAIIGPSGSGKSTLLGLLAGLDTATSGEISVCGENLGELDEDGRAALRARHVGFVFQSFQLLPALTALENVMLPLELAGYNNAMAEASRYLDAVGLAGRQRHYPRQLSGGEQQRVALARAFAVQPSLLFADEPTGNLDPATGDRIIELLFDLNRRNRTTLILVTHEQTLAGRCDRVVEIRDGVLQKMNGKSHA